VAALMKRIGLVSALPLLVATALSWSLLTAPAANAYGNKALWQVGLSFNCNNPSFCGNDLGGFWGWVEFDQGFTGDAELTGCGHSVGGGGPGGGAGHASVDITLWHIGPAQPGDPTYPGGQVFYVDDNVTTLVGHGPPQVVPHDPDFLGDSGIPAAPGHYSFHPAPGVAFDLQVAQLNH